MLKSMAAVLWHRLLSGGVLHYALPLALTALALALAYPRPGWGPLAHIALVPAAVLALRAASIRKLVLWSYLLSLAWWLWMIRWIVPVSLPGWLALSAYLALYSPLAWLALRCLVRRLALPALLALPLVWVSLEMLRSHLLAGGFSWFLLAHTQAPWLPSSRPPLLIQLADLAGEPLVSFLVALTNGLLVDLLTRPWFVPLPRFAASSPVQKPLLTRPPTILNPTMLASLALYLLLMLAAFAYSLWRIGEFLQLRKASPAPRLAVVQTNVPQTNKNFPTPQSEKADWARLLDLTHSAAASAPLLIVWPETAVPLPLDDQSLMYLRFHDPDRPASADYDQTIRHLAAETRAALLVGASALAWQDAGFRDTQPLVRVTDHWNSVFLYHPDGSRAPVRYDKIHLVPFGEFIPWVQRWPTLRRWFIRWLTPYTFDYTLTPGRIPTVFEIPCTSTPDPAHRLADPSTSAAASSLLRLVTPICFEDTVSRLCRRLVYDRSGLKRADLLVNLTNDGWFAGSDQPFQHLQAAVLRCVELRVPMARAVNTGVSGFVDSSGRILALVQDHGRYQQVDGSLTLSLPLDPRSSPFGFWGLLPAWGLTALSVLLLMFALVFPRRPSRHPRI